MVSRSASAADRVDELPLAHARPAGDVQLLRLGVELRPVAVLEGTPGLPTARTPSRRLRAEVAPRALRQVRDRPLLPRRPLRLLDVALRGGRLLVRRHGVVHLPWLRPVRAAIAWNVPVADPVQTWIGRAA